MSMLLMVIMNGDGHVKCFVLCFVRGDADVFRGVLGSYEDRQKILVSENGDLRNGLRDLQKELIAMLHCDSSDSGSAEVCCLELCTLNCFHNGDILTAAGNLGHGLHAIITNNKLCGRPPQYAPANCKFTFDILTL